MDVSLLENWQFYYKFAPFLLHIPERLRISQNMKLRVIQKSQFSIVLVNKKKFKSTTYLIANKQKSQFSIYFMNWEKLRSPTRATFKNPNFQSFCELGRSSK